MTVCWPQQFYILGYRTKASNGIMTISIGQGLRNDMRDGLPLLILRQQSRRAVRLSNRSKCLGSHKRMEQVLARKADIAKCRNRMITSIIAVLMSRRYLNRRYSPRSVEHWFNDRILPTLSASRFKFHSRVSRAGFLFILAQIEGSTYFQNKSTCPQIPIYIQLLLTLMRLGMDGNGSGFEAIVTKFGYSAGMINNAYNRVIAALSDRASDFIKWPGYAARNTLCEIGESFGFKDCFYTVDGTTMPLMFKPCFDHEGFFDRKSQYSMNVMVTNDLRKRIINVVVGFPGSVHDARVLRNARYIQERLQHLHYSGKQYGLGDSAFAPSRRLVPPYKRPLSLISENAQFNGLLASLRIYSEHTIGILKGRWKSLTGLRILLRKRENLVKVCNHIVACCVLHNLMHISGDSWDDMSIDASDDDTNEISVAAAIEQDGAEKREEVKMQCLEHFM